MNSLAYVGRDDPPRACPMRRVGLEIRECANVTLVKTRESNKVFRVETVR